METLQQKSTMTSKIIWLLVAIVGAVSFGILALSRGEHVNAVWLVLAAACVYSIAYRFYSLFIANKVFELNERRLTPAHRLADGLDYVPTNKGVLFGHHFAAIAGAGPLVGPILAAQMGYLPGTIWLLVGVVLAGAVQDFLVLFISTRRDGRSLGEMAKQELGTFAGIIVSGGWLFLLWLVRRDFASGLSFHFIGMTAVTLLLDWPLAVLGGFAAQLGLLALGRLDLFALGVNGMLLVVVLHAHAHAAGGVVAQGAHAVTSITLSMKACAAFALMALP